MPKKAPSRSSVWVKWLKTLEGEPVAWSVARIQAGKVALLEPQEAERAINQGLAVRYTPPKAKRKGGAR